MSSSKTPSSQSKRQATISSFFTQRDSSTIQKPLSTTQSKSQTSSPNNVSRDVNGTRTQPRKLSCDNENDKMKDFSMLTKRSLYQSDAEQHTTTGTSRKRRRIVPEDDENANDNDDQREEGNAQAELTQPSKTHESLAAASKDGRDRTSKYKFSSSTNGEDDGNDISSKVQREKMHQKFFKKLGRPDSIAEIKRRNHFTANETGEAEDDGDGEDGDGEDGSKAKKGKPANKGAGKLTPMVKQYLDIKRKHLDTVIVYQVGYKYRFFGEDARIASKELGLVCIPGKFRYDEHPSEAHIDRFASASFPLARLHVHVKRLVTAGHKVGVVRQLETAALKAAGDNRNAPFVRELTNVYTKGTYVDDVESLGETDNRAIGQNPSTGYLLCLTESNLKGYGDDEKVHVGILAVQPGTGSIIYDDFEDGFMRTEIETRLLHIGPCEYLIVGTLSSATEKLVKHLSGSKTNVFGDKARLERVEKTKTMAAESYSHVSGFYADKVQSTAESNDSPDKMALLDRVHQLTEHVTVCLSSMIKHLTEYGLEHVFDLTSNFQPFSAKTHMLLNGNTLNSLEIYKNQTDQREKGSLFWTMDRTKTRFGKRLLRNWVGRPLLDKTRLEERIQAVEELIQFERSKQVDKLKFVISSVKIDLEKILIRIYYGRAVRPEVLNFLQAFQRISLEYGTIQKPSEAGFKSDLVNEAISKLPRIGSQIQGFLERISLTAAKEDNKYTLFKEEHESEEINDHKLGIAAVEHDLDSHRADAAQKLGKKKVEYVTVAGIEYLIEVDNNKASLQKVPASWVKISGTKKCSRFHTPEVIKLLRERDQSKEALAAACDDAFSKFLAEISTHYQALRDCIQSLALLDCLLSLSEIASQPGYSKPEFTSESRLVIQQGRHPMVEQLLLDSYVPNDVRLSSTLDQDPQALLITGPNMGGKSSYVRSVALIAIMGQIGSYVPAQKAELGLMDAVFTRMGAFDNMMRGESTFMVELGETSDILKQATPRSLVILDELGRGTSTHDGVAIAEAVLRELLERRVMTMFITHYQDLSRMEGICEGLKNVHVKFTESGEEGEEITFLYEVGEGVAHRSYGLNVARLALVPKSVLDVAALKSQYMEKTIMQRKILSLSRMLEDVCGDDDEIALERLVAGIEQL